METWQKLNFIAAEPKSLGQPLARRVRVDGNTLTFFDAPRGDGAYVEVDTGSGTFDAHDAQFDGLSVINLYLGSRYHRAGERVIVFASPKPGQQFAGWEGFTGILDDPSSSVTTATIPGIGVELWLNATYKPLPPGMPTETL